MELWVRSQDRMAFSKYDLLIVEETPTGEYMFIADHYKNFGTYKTKERALEILDDIQNFIKNGCTEYGNNGDYFTSKPEFKVYEMPEE